MTASLFQFFPTDVLGEALPEKFTFPFYYEPHPLSVYAADLLKEYLATQTEWKHNFGLNPDEKGLEIGKMFGVLVVQNQQGELGYLWAFSGKLAESNTWSHFVPTVYDMLDEEGYFKKEEVLLNAINHQIKTLEEDVNYLDAKENLQKTNAQAELEITSQKKLIKKNKKLRAEKRTNALTNSEEEVLNKESQDEGILLKKMMQYWQHKLKAAQAELAPFEAKLETLKEERKSKSAALQQQLFEEYAFLNQYQKLKSLSEIFNGNPPAGAGECAAPKLLHYAFQHQLKPIAMTEFWWGKSPKSEVRKHGQFYPACTGKCEPILKHMLQGIPLDDNPFLQNQAEHSELEIIFEDDYLLLVNKPAEMLSVPGKQIKDSVATRLKKKYPETTGPLVVHRLDMSTSGILLIAKSSEIYKKLQHQFIKRSIKKRYVALLDGVIEGKKGEINLPLRVDLDNRPNQLVCYEYGKKAITHWEVIEKTTTRTKVYFYPITGRTHQLRVHAAHSLGLNTPIVGDDLYGTKANRLHLHAESITFIHPISNETVSMYCPAPF
ncbi:RluA family pseudouridine synthase [Flavobacterium capsici]|uniref:Pseudouridine synthase n=1 Tax=Flavobacterium capsici TaxID=3075618 RepID=A0AA96J1F3_9FLAO|nr:MULTISPECIES: pseudouridine synthase [unclassified Flavobacterium]WNM18282.1 pseudouridine synthase [Flavobacterium sp. PMR2A8]WNM22333.1 pseudouridine synthase [Flavobacterium sp. PMTSA4]